MWNSGDFDGALVQLVVICILAGVGLAVVLPWIWRTVILPLLRILVA
jgi:hypothetical protein